MDVVSTLTAGATTLDVNALQLKVSILLQHILQ